MDTILFCWVGSTDLKAVNEAEKIGLGPIAQAVTSRKYNEVVLLSDFDKSQAEPYAKWLHTKTRSTLTLHQVTLSGPTDFGEIYQAANDIVSRTISKRRNTSLTFHLSPGTSAMAAVWVILAKSKFSAELIESSREHGVVTSKIPFEIAADFIPELLRESDEELERLAAGMPDDAPEFSDIIHRSATMKEVILKARIVAPRSISVLLEGESGTGKEVFAKAIHNSSPRKKKKFITVNCGAIPPELIESELFGHEKGAFTGADRMRRGCFEEADGGTLFLDEIGELPKLAQVKMLRALQEREISRVGSNKMIKTDVRIIAATNKDLIKEVSKGNFREDLFFRLAVAVLKLPPLRERTGDITLLIDSFLDRINNQYSKGDEQEDKKISANAKKIMLAHPWPGNIRELQNTITRAVVWSPGKIIREKDIKNSLLPMVTEQSSDRILGRSLDDGVDLNGIIKTVASHYLRRALKKTNNNKTKSAELLGFKSYQTLSNWMKKYDLE